MPYPLTRIARRVRTGASPGEAVGTQAALAHLKVANLSLRPALAPTPTSPHTTRTGQGRPPLASQLGLSRLNRPARRPRQPRARRRRSINNHAPALLASRGPARRPRARVRRRWAPRPL